MKRKLLLMLTVAVLMTLAPAVMLGAGEGTISWTQAAAVCYVSDVYYYTEAGQKAFIAGELTEIPAGAEVYMTLRPRPLDDASTRLLDGAFIEFGSEKVYLLRDGGQADADGGGVFSFVMPEHGTQTAYLSVSCVPLYDICCGNGLVLEDGAFCGERGALRVLCADGMSVSHAAAGDELMVVVEPDSSSALARSSLTVTAASGKNVALTRGADGAYRFTMPAESVTLGAAFAPAAPITLPKGVKCAIGGEYAYVEPYRALPGSTVSLTVSPDDDDERIRRGSQSIEPADACIGEANIDSESGAISCNVIMPEGGLNISAEVGTLCRIEHDDSIELFAEDRITRVTSCCAGDVLYASLHVPNGYGLLNGALTITASDEEQTVAQRIADSDDASVVCVRITAPMCDMSISADLRPLRRIGNVQPQGLGVIQTYPARSAAAGSTVTVALLPAEGWQVREGSLAICAAGGHDEVSQVENGCFIMPDFDCEISAEFIPIPHEAQSLPGGCFDVELSYTLNASGAVDASAKEGIPAGALVRAEALSHAGCKIRGLYLARMDDGKVCELSAGAQATFIMPDCAIAVYALCTDESHTMPDLACIPTSGSSENETVKLSAEMLPCGASVYTTERNLRLREDCNAESDVVDTYASGTRVTIDELGTDGEWAHVTIDGDGKRGWMKTEYLIPDAAVQTPQINIIVRLPEIKVNRPYLVEQERANESGGYVFKHILLL